MAAAEVGPSGPVAGGAGGPADLTFRDEKKALVVGACSDWEEFALPADDKTPITGGGTRADVIRSLVYFLIKTSKTPPTSLEAHYMPLAPLLAAEQGISDVRSFVATAESVGNLSTLARTATEKLSGSRWALALQKSYQGTVVPSESISAADRTFDISVASIDPDAQGAFLPGFLNALVGRIAEGGSLLLEAQSRTLAETQQVISALHEHFAIVNSTSPEVSDGRQIFVARGSYAGAAWETRTGVSSIVRIAPDHSKVVKSPKPDSPHADTYTRELRWLMRLQKTGYVPQVLAANEAKQEIVMSHMGQTIEEAVAAAPDKPLRMPSDWTAQLLLMHGAFAQAGLAYTKWAARKLCVRTVKDTPGRLAVVGFGRCGAVLVDSTCGGTVAPLAATPAAPRTVGDLSQDLKKLGLLR